MVNPGVRGFADLTPARFRHWSILAFAVWNAVIWATRVRNVLADHGISGATRARWLLPALVFFAGAALAGLAWWRGLTVLARPLALIALLAVLYWPVRAVLVLFDSHAASFKLVHVGLAVVSVALALAVLNRLYRTGLIPIGAYR